MRFWILFLTVLVASCGDPTVIDLTPDDGAEGDSATCDLAACVTACISGGFVGGTCSGNSCTCVSGADADADGDGDADGEADVESDADGDADVQPDTEVEPEVLDAADADAEVEPDTADVEPEADTEAADEADVDAGCDSGICASVCVSLGYTTGTCEGPACICSGGADADADGDVELDSADADADGDSDVDAETESVDTEVDDATTETDASGSCPPGMALIPAGPFVMGSDAAEAVAWDAYGETPEHIVTVSAYCMDLTEVTNARYRECVGAGECTIPSGVYGPDDYPVAYVTWAQADVFCNWTGGRLPTEAEWEKAARGGCEIVAPTTCGPEDERNYPWGDATLTCVLANIDVCLGQADRVGVRPAGDSPYDLHDMSGNVWEWASDWWDPNYYATCASGCTDPTGPAETGLKVLRGGGWDYWYALGFRVAYRNHRTMPSDTRGWIGFRCASSPF
jgi:formylglycine-generating enzyme required for sulfatase activity